jgi:hypothetical protein
MINSSSSASVILGSYVDKNFSIVVTLFGYKWTGKSCRFKNGKAFLSCNIFWDFLLIVGLSYIVS